MKSALRATTKSILFKWLSVIEFETRNVTIIISVTTISEIKFGKKGSVSRVILFFRMIYARNIGIARVLTTMVSSRINERLVLK